MQPTSYQLLTNGNATSPQVGPVAGGDYVFRCEGTYGGSTCKLQVLGLDGVTWFDVASASFTANNSLGVSLGQGAIARVNVASGSPSALYAALQGLSG